MKQDYNRARSAPSPLSGRAADFNGPGIPGKAAEKAKLADWGRTGRRGGTQDRKCLCCGLPLRRTGGILPRQHQPGGTYVQTAVGSAGNQDYRLTVDSAVCDSQTLYAVITVEGRTTRPLRT